MFASQALQLYLTEVIYLLFYKPYSISEPLSIKSWNGLLYRFKRIESVVLFLEKTTLYRLYKLNFKPLRMGQTTIYFFAAIAQRDATFYPQDGHPSDSDTDDWAIGYVANRPKGS